MTSATSLGRSGLSDWLVQRLSAVVLAAWTLRVLVFVAARPELDHAQWRALFDGAGMRYFSALALASLCAHAWIGMWTVGTDYLTERRLGGAALPARLAYLLACALGILLYLFWGLSVFRSAA